MVTRRQFSIGALGAAALSIAPVRLRRAKGDERGNVKCVWPAGAALGEGPIWDEDEGAVYWIDIKAPAVHRYTPATGATQTRGAARSPSISTSSRAAVADPRP